MSVNAPKVSIGLPVYNGENFVAQAIESILSQTFKDFEVVISDNASTDGTEQICKAYQSKDSRVKYFRVDKNKGAAWNFNQVFKLSSGEYFKWFAHDDLIAPDFLEKCVNVLDRAPQAVLAYTRVKVIDEEGKSLLDYDLKLETDSPHPHVRFRDLLVAWSMCYEIFGLFRANALAKTPLMGNYGHGDGVLLARLGLLGTFIEIPEPLFFSRKHPNQSMRVFGISEKGGNDYHRYAVWFDPSKAGKILLPNWEIFWEYYKSIWQYPTSLFSKIYLHPYFLLWMRKHIRLLFQDLVIAARQLFRGLKTPVTTTPEPQDS